MALPQPTWGEVYIAPAGITADDLLRLPDDGYRYELFEGKLVREMTTPGHGAICHRLSIVLYLYAQRTGFANQVVQNALFDLSPPGAARRARRCSRPTSRSCGERRATSLECAGGGAAAGCGGHLAVPDDDAIGTEGTVLS